MIAIDLFCGAGGMAEGLQAAGFDVVMGLDYDADAVTASVAAGHRAAVWDLSQGLPPGLPQPDLLHVSCPCQPFSQAGKIFAADDPRNGWPWALSAIAELRPTWLSFENVKGLTQHKQQAHKLGTQAQACPRCYLDGTILAELRMLFAWVDWRVVNCADLGVPQRRERLIVLAGPRPLTWSEGDYSEEALVRAKWADGSYWAEHGMASVGAPSRREAQVLKGLGRAGERQRWRTVRDVLGLGGAMQGQGNPETVSAGGNALLDPGPQASLSQGVRALRPDEPATTVDAGSESHRAPWIERTRGAGLTERHGARPVHAWDDPAPTVAAGSKGSGPRMEIVYPHGLGRAASEPERLDTVAPTVTTTEAKGTRAHSPDWTFHGGPDRASDAAFLATGRRRLTVAECAVLQGFSPSYPFRGTKTAQYRQVGNACPPALGEMIGRMVVDGFVPED